MLSKLVPEARMLSKLVPVARMLSKLVPEGSTALTHVYLMNE